METSSGLVEPIVLDSENSFAGATPRIGELPAGGPDPDRFDWREVWYPVHYVRDLDRTRPTAFTLLEQDLVIWWDRQASTWRVMADQCPHRLVPLSEGRIAEDGLLECPYHGWAFGGDGSCQRIPQQLPGSQAEQSSRACVASLPTVERQGLLFVYPGDPERARATKIPLIEPLEEIQEGWICLDTFRDLPYDALTLMENVLDSSHISYTHHKTIGNRANASPVELEIVAHDRQGFTGLWQEGPRRGTLGQQHTTFLAPNLMWHDLTSKQFGRTLTVVYATPTRKGECRTFARFPFRFASPLPGFFIKLTPTWYSHINQNGILEDDQIFLHLQERYLEAKGGSANFTRACYLPTRADRFVLQLRQWVNQYSQDPFAGQGFRAAQSRQQLLERYHSHTAHCASCRRALTNIQRLRTGIAAVGAMALAVTPLLQLMPGNPVLPAGLLTGLLLTCSVAWAALGRLGQQFYQGKTIPPRNLPDKKKR